MSIMQYRISLVALALLCQGAFAADSPSEHVAREAIIARIEAMQNLYAEYVETIDTAPYRVPPGRAAAPKPPPGVPTVAGGATLMLTVPSQVYSHVFSFLHGDARWESTMSAATLEEYKRRKVDTDFHVIRVWHNGRMDVLFQKIVADRTSGRMTTTGGEEFELALGLRKYSPDQRVVMFDRPAVEQMAIHLSENGDAILSENSADGDVLEYTFSSSHGFALVGFHSKLHPIDVGQTICQDFKIVNNVTLPTTIIWRVAFPDGTDSVRRTDRVSAYKLDDPNNTADRYQMRWKKGVLINDSRTGASITASADNQILDDAQVAQMVLQQEMERSERRRAAASQPRSPGADELPPP